MGGGSSKPKKVNNISPFDSYKVGMINVNSPKGLS